MATEVVKIVDPDSGAGVDYVSLNTWESNEQGDLTGVRDEIAIAKCRCTGGTANVLTSDFVIDGWDTSATQYIKIWTDPNESYRHAGIWSDSKFRITSTSEIADTCKIYESYTVIEGLQIASTTYARTYFSGITLTSAPTKCTIQKNIIKDVGSSTDRYGILVGENDGYHNILNNIIYDFDTTDSVGIRQDGAINESYFYNNTIHNCYKGFSSGVYLKTLVKNNIVNDSINESYNGSNNYMPASTHNIGGLDPNELGWGVEWTSGTTTASGSNKLIDTGKDFNVLGVQIGSVVEDGSSNFAYVTAIDSATILSISDDIMGLSEGYTIYTNMFGTVAFENSASASFNLTIDDTVARTKAIDLSTDPYFPVTDDILGNTRRTGSDYPSVGAFDAEIDDVSIMDFDSGAGFDYSTFSDWESNEQENTTLTRRRKVAKCRNSSGGTGIGIIVTGWTTSEGFYIKIWADPTDNYRHSGVYDNSKFRVEETDSDIFNLHEDYIVVDGIQFTETCTVDFYNMFSISLQNTDNVITIKNCILKGVYSGTGAGYGIYINDGGSNAVVHGYNNIIYGFINGATTLGGIRAYDCSTSYFYNNTIFNCYRGFYGGSGNPFLKNNLLNGITNDGFNGTFSTMSAYNVADLYMSDLAFGVVAASGVTTGVSDLKFSDSGSDFSSIQVNSVIKDSGGNHVYVTAVDSSTTLSVSENHFSLGEAYTIYANMFGTVTFNDAVKKDFRLSVRDTVAKDKGTDLSSDIYLAFDDDILGVIRPVNNIWDVGAHEYQYIPLWPGYPNVVFYGSGRSGTINVNLYGANLGGRNITLPFTGE